MRNKMLLKPGMKLKLMLKHKNKLAIKDRI